MPTSVTWNNSARSIPSAGELNWSALSAFLVDLANNAQTTNFQKFGITTATASPVAVSASSNCVVITDLTIAGAVAVNLPAGVIGQAFFIVDGKGDAATNNVTITPNGGQTINGAANYVINRNKAGIGISFIGTDWKIIAEFSNEVQAKKVTGSYGSPFAVVAGTGITPVPNALTNVIYVQGSGGAVDISANPQIAAGTRDGDELILHGCSDTNTIYLEHGNGLFINGNMYLKSHSVLTMNWDSTNSLWVEKSRTEY